MTMTTIKLPTYRALPKTYFLKGRDIIEHARSFEVSTLEGRHLGYFPTNPLYVVDHWLLEEFDEVRRAVRLLHSFACEVIVARSSETPIEEVDELIAEHNLQPVDIITFDDPAIDQSIVPNRIDEQMNRYATAYVDALLSQIPNDQERVALITGDIAGRRAQRHITVYALEQTEIAEMHMDRFKEGSD